MIQKLADHHTQFIICKYKNNKNKEKKSIVQVLSLKNLNFVTF